MSLKKLPDPKWKLETCRDPGHNPPNMMVYKNGTYEWTCDACGLKQVFTVNHPTLSLEDKMERIVFPGPGKTPPPPPEPPRYVGKWG